jgi:hypothetical protein
MYPDHMPPHMHLIGPGWSAVIELATLTVTRGRAPKRELAEALGWMRANIDFLEAEWAQLNERN